MEKLKQQIKQQAEKIYPHIIELRAYLHKNPELSFEEHNTSRFIASKLTELGIPYKDGYATTGIVGRIEGKNPQKRVLALRADMDALPVDENPDNPHCSINKGVMHACGHDIHMASLLGVAQILNNLKEHWEGTILLVFQPGEELLPGGARLMIDQGALTPRPDWIVAQHVFPDMPTGTVGFRPGMYMASGDEIYLTVKGDGGHAAMPHNLTDTVLIASHIVVALQQIVSRHCDARVPTVLSFGKMVANGATNIIPGEVNLEGTFRTMDETWRKRAKALITDIAQSTARSMGGECQVRIVDGYPFLVNDKQKTAMARDWSNDLLGHDKVVDMDIRMTTEDFGYYTQQYPATFYRLGVKPDDQKVTSALHTANFIADEKALLTGMSLMSWLAVSFLNK